MSGSLLGRLEASFAQHRDRTALVQGDALLTYDELWGRACELAQRLSALAPSREDDPFVAVVGSRSLGAYENLLGIVLAGRAYLALEPEQPPARLASLLDRAGVRWVLSDLGSLPLVLEVLPHAHDGVRVLVPDASEDDLGSVPGEVRDHLVAAGDLRAPARDVSARADGPWRPDAVAPDDPLYLLFTSGSTGEPKGVVIEHGNVSALLSGLTSQLDMRPTDVVAQLFKLSFDPSVMAIMHTWTSGASLVVPEPDSGVLSEARLIPRYGVTHWFAVPSRTSIMRRLRQLQPGAYPTLRYVVHGGEALTTEGCTVWAQAAPGARVVNQYGPTETTVAVTQYVWDPQRSPAECDGIRVPIGYPLPGVEALIVDEDLRSVPDDATGELLIGGPQVSRGYLGDPARTAAVFVTVPGHQGRFYRTGDVVRRPDPAGPIHFVGRRDDQVKVLGRRIELGEIEAAVRATLGVDEVAALGWPETPGGYDGIEVFVVGDAVDGVARDRLAAALPPEAVPRHVRPLREMPLTANGKIDRAALRSRLLGSSA